MSERIRRGAAFLGRRFAGVGNRDGSLSLVAATSDYLASSASNLLTPATDKISIAMLVYIAARPADTAYMGVVHKANHGVASSYGVRLGSSTFGDVLTADMTASAAEIYGNSSLSKGGRYSYPIGGWHWLVWTYDSAAVGTAKSTLYWNTNPLDKTAYTGTLPADILTSASAFELGNVKTSGARASFLGANVSKLYVYDYVLTEANQRSIASGSAPSNYVAYWPFARDTTDVSVNAFTSTLGGSARLAPGTRPTPYASFVRVHCIGDSLTRGQEPDWSGTYRGGYRSLLAESLAASGIYMRGVGGQPTNEGWVNDHDGHNGDLVGDILAACTGSAARTPDVVIPMAGTNDCRSGATTLATCFANYTTMMANIFTGQTPYVPLPRPPPFLLAETDKGQEWAIGMSSYVINTLAPAAAVTYGSSNVCGVDVAWVTGDICSDSVHLSAQGYQRLADALSTAVRTRPSQGTAPAVTHRAALRSAATVTGLWSGRKYQTITSGKVSSWLDTYADEAGTGGHAATQGTAAARPLATGAGVMFLAGQDDATADVLALAAGSVTSGAYTSFVLARFLYNPTVDLNDAFAFYCVENASGGFDRAFVRSLDAGATFNLYIASSATTENCVSVPWTHSTTAVRRVLIQWDGVSRTAASSYYVEVDGVSQTVSTTAIGSVAYDSGTLGGLLYLSTLYFAFGGVLREVGFLSGSSAAAATAARTYLATAMPDGL